MGAYLALRRGRRVLAIDMDPQGQLGKVFAVEVHRQRRSAIDLLLDSLLEDPLETPPGSNPAPESAGALPVVPTRIRGLDLIVANKALAVFPAWNGADADADPTGRLQRTLNGAPELADYDFVFMDAPPSFGPLTLNVLRAAEEVVIPVPLTYLALDGCAELERTLASVRSRYHNPGLRISLVVPTFYRRTRLAHEMLERLSSRFPKTLAQTVVGFHVKIDEAQSKGRSIFEHAPRSRGAQAMAALAEELELRNPLEEAPQQ